MNASPSDNPNPDAHAPALAMPTKPPALTPKKFSLLVVLSVAMGGVWWNAFAGDSATPVATTTARTATARPSNTRPAVARSQPRPETPTAVTDEPAAEQAAARDGAQWPAMTLNDATRNDPFAKPYWAITATPGQTVAVRRATTAGSREARRRLESLGASMIFISGDEKIAAIDGREVHVGDLVEGFVVADITPTGVVFENRSPDGS